MDLKLVLETYVNSADPVQMPQNVGFEQDLTLLHSERPKLHTILVFLSAVGLNCLGISMQNTFNVKTTT